MANSSVSGGPTVSHLVRTFLFITGSWIYGQLRNLRSVRPIVVTTRTENLNTFPFEPVFVYREISYLRGRKGAALRNTFELATSRKARFYARVCREQDVRLLHAHFGTEGYYQLPVKRKLGIPMVTTYYGSDISQAPRASKWRRRYRRLFDEGECFLFEGSHMAQQAVDLRWSPNKLRVLHLGVDLDAIEFIPRTPNKDGRIKVLLAASFREKKGIPYALEAFASAAKKLPELELTIIGGAKTEQECQLLRQCQAIVARHQIGERVRFLGYVPYSVYLEEQKHSHIFLAPSVTASNGDSEGGAPVSVIEASAAGMPVISTRHCDIPEVILDGVSGVLVAERDVSALSRAILEVAMSSETWPEMGRQGRAHAQAEYNVKMQVVKLEQVYRGLL